MASGRIRTGNAMQIYNYGVWDAQSDQTIGQDFAATLPLFTIMERFANPVARASLTMPR